MHLYIDVCICITTLLSAYLMFCFYNIYVDVYMHVSVYFYEYVYV